jgi:hypothetical protein
MSKHRFLALFLFLILFLGSSPSTRVLAETDKTALNDAYAAIQTAIANEGIYEASSFAAFETDYTALGGDLAVQAMQADLLADQTAIDAMTAALLDLLSHLTLQSTYVRISALFWPIFSTVPTGFTNRSMTLYNLEMARLDAVLNNPRSGETAIAQIEFALTAAQALLIPLANRTALDETWTELQAITANDEEQYTPSTFALFLAAVADFSTELIAATGLTVAQIIASNDVSVAEANAAILAMETAVTILSLRADKTALIAAMDLAEARDLSTYTPNSRALYANGLVAIQLVIDDLEATVLEVEAAISDLLILSDVLIDIVNKTNLELKNAEVLLAFYEERHLYTVSSYQAFKTAVLGYGHYFTVETVIADLNASEAEVTELLEAMDLALDLLVLRGNTALLSSTYSQLTAINLSTFTPASIALFQTALQAIPAILQSEDADQTLIDQTLASLSTYPALLVLLADQSLLRSELDAARAISRFRYSQAFLLTLDLYIAAGETVLNNPNASQAQVNQAFAHLDTLLSGWMLKTTEQAIRANQDSFDLKPLVFQYQTTITSYLSSNPDILTVDEFGIVTGHQFGSATVTVSLANGVVEVIHFQVKADVSTGTILLAALVPFVVTGMGFLMIFFKPSHLDFLKKIALFRKKV